MVIKEETKEDMLHVLDTFWKQCEDATQMGCDIKVELPVNALVVCGMGDSAIAGEVLQAYLDLSVPLVVVSDYELPKFVNRNTLVFLVSYSGNTEEVLSCYKYARARGSKVVAIASGGRLEELCLKGANPFIKVPAGLQPRDSTGFLTIPMLNVLASSKVIKMRDSEYPDMIGSLRKDLKERAQAVALKMKNRIPLIYSSARMRVLAKTWKKKIVENAKTHVFCNDIAEATHNEIAGFNKQEGSNKKTEDYFVVIIEDINDHPRVKKRAEILKKIVQDSGTPVMVLKVSGQNRLSNIFSTLLFGSYVGYYLAEEYGINPARMDILDEVKRQLGKYHLEQ